MRIGIKYCGGCNPRFRGGAVAERLRCDFPDVLMASAVDAGGTFDLVVVVCGCKTACATRTHPAGSCGTVLVTHEEEYEKAASRLSEIRGGH
ncbi:MAG: hypothetical protein LBJ46_07500 [Planctomycetota bacterium]|jgi:4-hydroxybutyrate CoA-transferase|nr:hypothetical protein [Planctomycetota bacterium]